MLAVGAVPAIYALIYLTSVWDPAGHTGDLPAAIVNEDNGVTYLGRSANVGNELTRIFDPFIQVSRSLTNVNHEGVGLGLAISRNLARAMGGNITVSSTVDVGSTFTLSLARAHP